MSRPKRDYYYMKKEFVTVIGLFFIYMVCYKFTNFIFIGEPHLIPATAIDHFFGFNPHWIWIYLSSFLSVPLCYLLLFYKEKRRFLSCFIFLTLSSCSIYFIFPTYVPRSSFIPPNFYQPYDFIFRSLHQADGITNCLPSLHVSTAFLCTWLAFKHHPKVAKLLFVYSTLVAISTMTVKQHYFWDVLTGFLMSLIAMAPLIISRRQQQV